MAAPIVSALVFIVGLTISTIIIYIAAKLLRQKEGIGHAFAAAIIGASVYSLTYFVLGTGWLAAIVGGIVWPLVLRALYDNGWLRALNGCDSVDCGDSG